MCFNVLIGNKDDHGKNFSFLYDEERKTFISDLNRIAFCDLLNNFDNLAIFNDKEKLIKYVQGIQMGSPIDSSAIPMPWDMPGYEDQVIMAAGAFTQGSSIELSCDGPIRPPYIAYQQGGLTYEYGFLGIAKAIEELKK